MEIAPAVAVVLIEGGGNQEMAVAMTPMMRQYVELKEKYSDCLLFFRLGDFYEMFFDDAKLASRELELTLTGRDCGMTDRAPMCGVPYHSVDTYITRLIAKGYKVAICEQMEDPALAQGLVERDVIRIITPGTVIEEKMLEEGKNNYIAAILYRDGGIGLAYADVSTGGFYIEQLYGESVNGQLTDELARIQPTEIIANDALFEQQLLKKRLSTQYYLERAADPSFLLDSSAKRLQRHFNVASLTGFGCDHCEDGVRAAGALMQYLEETQKNALSHIQSIKVINRSAYMVLDAATRRNLELTQPLRAGASKKNTMLYLLNRTQTSMGSRMLRDWIDRPLQTLSEIVQRQDAVQLLCDDFLVRKTLQDLLKEVYDIERLSSKIVYGSINGRDCIALLHSLWQIPNIINALLHSETKADALTRIRMQLNPMDDIKGLLAAAICDEPPVSVKEGGIIRDGYHAEVDELRRISSGSKDWLERFEATERESTGIKNLKIGFNRVFGYYIEVTKSFTAAVPYYYERKQTLANAERYITPELKEMEQKILGAHERLISLEYDLFQKIRQVLLGVTKCLQENAALLAELDVYQSLAEVATAQKYCRPAINTEGKIAIEAGRHPVIEQSTKEHFVPNDVLLDNADNRLLIITGPNMAGKSTYMRQVALITLMAMIGSYVPAASADICIVDRIFTRIGASDDLSSGQSTFMVEMSEMANILNNATPNSLLILDEIGRGTSTFDGLSIAWSVLEFIASKRRCGAKSLFATHYHELTELEGKLEGVKNYRISVKEIGEDIVFFRKIVRGHGDKSFGIQVARLAGIPNDVLMRARDILNELEKADITAKKAAKRLQQSAVQETLFAIEPDPVAETILKKLANIDPDSLSPLEALNELYQLKKVIKKG